MNAVCMCSVNFVCCVGTIGHVTLKLIKYFCSENSMLRTALGGLEMKARGPHLQEEETRLINVDNIGSFRLFRN